MEVCRLPLQCLSQQKDGEEEKGRTIVRVAYLPQWGIFLIYRAWFPNLRSYFRNNISFSLSKIILLRNKG